MAIPSSPLHVFLCPSFLELNLDLLERREGHQTKRSEACTAMAITPSSSSSSSYSSSSSSSSPLPCSLLRSSPHFNPIKEEETEYDEELEPNQSTDDTYDHQPTPLHPSSRPPLNKSSRREGPSVSVSCSKCRPSSRDKISVTPLDPNGQKRHSSVFGPTPNGLRSIFSMLTRKSPIHVASTPSASSSVESAGEWKLAMAELSKKLLQVTRKRDDALLEASRLKYSMSELEGKLNRLESYCRDLRSSLDRCSTGPSPAIVEPFLLAVNDARSAVHHLSRSLLAQLRASPRSLDRLGSLLHSNGMERQNPKSLVIGLESSLNRVFYSDFERAGEGEGILVDPVARCTANRTAYEVVRVLGWENVLSKGTKHYSEGLSRFCDWKMSEVVALLGWARPWPEVLLQAFFGAARGVWVVHLLARSVHPALPILRVDRGARFDPRYMEDVSAAKSGTGELAMMVAPGFYVPAAGCSVVKCRVVMAFAERIGSEVSDGPKNGNRVEVG